MSQFNIEKLLLKLYNDVNDRFYSYLFFQVDRREFKAPFLMGVGVDKSRLTLVYNPTMVGEYVSKHSEDHMITVLKHEALHLINGHLFRVTNEERKDKVNGTMWNLAQDCSINQLLNQKHLEDIGAVTLNKFKELLTHKPASFKLLPHQTSDYYYELLKEEKEKREEQNGKDGKGDVTQMMEAMEGMQKDDHNMFGDLDPLEQAMLEDKLNKAYEQAKASGAGNMPSEIEELFKMMRKPKVNWKRELKRFFGNGIRVNKKPTRSKRNRRYGLVWAGKKKDYIAKILTVIDTSGSMSNDMIQQALDEVYGIYQATPSLQLDIVECDTKVQDVFTYTGEQKFNIKGRGGTEFQPALDYAKQHKYDGIVFLTDGGCFSAPVNTGVPVLWGIIGGYKFDCTFGTILEIREGA